MLGCIRPGTQVGGEEGCSTAASLHCACCSTYGEVYSIDVVTEFIGLVLERSGVTEWKRAETGTTAGCLGRVQSLVSARACAPAGGGGSDRLTAGGRGGDERLKAGGPVAKWEGGCTTC
jgi:hypothetical protein